MFTRIWSVTVLSLLLLAAVGVAGCSDDPSDSPQPARPSPPAESAPPAAPAESAIATAKPAAAPPKTAVVAPIFDPGFLLGHWEATIEVGEDSPPIAVEVSYTEERYVLRMLAGGGQPVEASGVWVIEGDVLIETPEKSDLPFWRVGVATRSTILILDREQLIFDRDGSVMRYTRAGY